MNAVVTSTQRAGEKWRYLVFHSLVCVICVTNCRWSTEITAGITFPWMGCVYIE